MKRAVSRFVFRLILLTLLCGGLFWLWQALTPIHHPPGVLVRGEPVQQVYTRQSDYFPSRDGFSLSRMAQYRIRARVLSTKRYRDQNARLAPIDMALGWGPMSDTAVLSKLSVSQGNRFFFVEWEKAPPLPENVIQRSSANVHLIPANKEVGAFLSKVKEGALIDFRGALVEARKENTRWRSSLRRDDTGNGSCEILYVEQARLITLEGDRAETETFQRTAVSSRNNIHQWYNSLAEWRETLQWGEPEAIRAFNEEAARYQAAMRPAAAPAVATPPPPPAKAKPRQRARQ